MGSEETVPSVPTPPSLASGYPLAISEQRATQQQKQRAVALPLSVTRWAGSCTAGCRYGWWDMMVLCVLALRRVGRTSVWACMRVGRRFLRQ